MHPENVRKPLVSQSFQGVWNIILKWIKYGLVLFATSMKISQSKMCSYSPLLEFQLQPKISSELVFLSCHYSMRNISFITWLLA